jgi:UPF0716 family protein affecting phage T7 exclusion
VNESAKAVGTTAQQEIPLLVQEYLRWGIGDALMWMLLTVSMGVSLLRMGKRMASFPETRSYGGYDGERLFFSRYVFPMAGWAFIIVGFVTNLYQVLQVLIAPRVYLLQQVRELVK